MAIRRLPILAACVAALAVPAGAGAEDPPFVPVTDALPALPGTYRDSVFDACADGDAACVEATLDEMYRRYGELVTTCDHNAVFALTYIRVTEIYRDRADTFDEPRFLAHEDAVFAQLFFDAHDAWAAGRRDEAPEAWLLAFDAGRDRLMPAIGNVLLGINAHVNRDMPFMLAGLGLVKPDGSARKADHDYFNRLLNEVYDDVIGEMTQRFDPTTDDSDVPGTTLDNMAIFQILPGWREMVWRHAELLSAAPTPEARELVAAEIEAYAAAQARLIRAMLGREGSSAKRDAWCAAHAGTAEHARSRTYP
jgi:hypothetical protein